MGLPRRMYFCIRVVGQHVVDESTRRGLEHSLKVVVQEPQVFPPLMAILHGQHARALLDPLDRGGRVPEVEAWSDAENLEPLLQTCRRGPR